MILLLLLANKALSGTCRREVNFIFSKLSTGVSADVYYGKSLAKIIILLSDCG